VSYKQKNFNADHCFLGNQLDLTGSADVELLLS